VPIRTAQASSWCVLKFGGSSLASPALWTRQLGVLKRRLEAGERPLLVYSAVGETTDDLEGIPDQPPDQRSRVLDRIRERHLRLARGLDLEAVPEVDRQLRDLAAWIRTRPAGPDWDPPSRATLVSQGELLSTRFGAAWLRTHGLSVRWLDARDVLVAPGDGHTERDFLSAECDCTYSPAERARFDAFGEQVVLTQGFLARNPAGETVVLGRGGSDTAAAYLAARLGAARVEIWTDVPGLFTANPRAVSGARLIHRLGYAEAEALATMGAAALHPRSIGPVRDAGIPMHIAWTRHPELEGTVIGSQIGAPGVKAISSRNGLCLVSTRRPASWQPVGFMADVAECFRKHELCMDLVSSSPSDIRATVDLDADPSAETRMDALLEDLNRVAEASLIGEAASVSLVGREIRSVLPDLGDTLRHLEGHAIHLLAQSANDHSLTWVTERESTSPLVENLHGALFGGPPTGDTFGPTWRELQATVPDLGDGREAVPALSRAS